MGYLSQLEAGAGGGGGGGGRRQRETTRQQVRLDSRGDDRDWGWSMKKEASPYNTPLRMEPAQFLIFCLRHETCFVLSLASARGGLSIFSAYLFQCLRLFTLVKCYMALCSHVCVTSFSWLQFRCPLFLLLMLHWFNTTLGIISFTKKHWRDYWLVETGSTGKRESELEYRPRSQR